MLPQHKLLEQGAQHGFPFAERETAWPGMWHEERLTVTPSPRWTLLVSLWCRPWGCWKCRQQKHLLGRGFAPPHAELRCISLRRVLVVGVP